MPKHCPKCKSQNITLRSRRKYLLIMGAGVSIIGLGFLFFYGAWVVDGGLAGLMSLSIGVIFFLVGLGTGIYNMVRAILTKITSYRCEYCKNQFEEPLTLPSVKRDDYLSDIRRPLSRN